MANSLFHGRDVLARNRAADDAVFKDEAGTALERLDTDVRNTELTVPAALLLVAPLRLCGSTDRLAKGELDLVSLDLDAELPSQSFEDNLEVELP
jgi:hypothetical protein